MATLTIGAGVGIDGPGKGRRVPVMATASRTVGIYVFTFNFDSSYPTGGEDISTTAFADLSPWAILKGGVLAILPVQQPGLSSGTGKWVVADITNKKLMVYTNAAAPPAEVANGSDQSGITGLTLVAIGYY